MTDGSRPAVRPVLAEVVALWLVTLVLIRAVLFAVPALGLPELFLALVPVLFIYMPVGACQLRGVDSWSYPLALPSFRDPAPWLDALKWNALLVGIIFVPWLGLYHWWQTALFPEVVSWVDQLAGWASGEAPGWRVPPARWTGEWPDNLLMLVGYHLFYVAIPEEFFYRGYLQTRLNEAFSHRIRVLGAMVGPGLILATVLFAFGHTIVVFRPWHAAILIPGFAFAWLRARTGDTMAGALFHAWCNVTVTTLDILYGLQSP